MHADLQFLISFAKGSHATLLVSENFVSIFSLCGVIRCDMPGMIARRKVLICPEQPSTNQAEKVEFMASATP